MFVWRTNKSWWGRFRDKSSLSKEPAALAGSGTLYIIGKRNSEYRAARTFHHQSTVGKLVTAEKASSPVSAMERGGASAFQINSFIRVPDSSAGLFHWRLTLKLSVTVSLVMKRDNSTASMISGESCHDRRTCMSCMACLKP